MWLGLYAVDVSALAHDGRVLALGLLRAVQIATSHECIARRGGHDANDEEGSGDKFHAGDSSKSIPPVERGKCKNASIDADCC